MFKRFFLFIKRLVSVVYGVNYLSIREIRNGKVVHEYHGPIEKAPNWAIQSAMELEKGCKESMAEMKREMNRSK